MGILSGRRLLITGIRAESSIAYHVAQRCEKEGAELVLSAPPRALAALKLVAASLQTNPRVIELDVNSVTDIDGLAKLIGGKLDGVLHSIAFAPKAALGGFMPTSFDAFSVAVQTSAFSFKELIRGVTPILNPGASVVAMSFDPSVAWPSYDWMGVSKAALEAIARYLARELGPLGVQVNIVSPGVISSPAALGIPGFDLLASAFENPPLKWDVHDVGTTVTTLLSGLMPGVTGEVLKVDGGMHAIGAK